MLIIGIAAALLTLAGQVRPPGPGEGGECPRLAASGASADLYCIRLFPAAGFDASGTAELSWVEGPFTVAVARDGTHRWNLRFSVRGLPDSLLHGRRSGFVAWAASPTMARLVRLGSIHGAGDVELGPVALDRFLVLISAEPDTSVREPRGRMVLRGESASNRLRPPDNYQFFLGSFGAPRPPEPHAHEGMQSDESGWTHVPMFPGLDMLPAEMALRPEAMPWLPGQSGAAAPARPAEVVNLQNGDTLALVAGPVRRTIAGREYTMLGFNGQYPGPLLRVEQGAEVVVRLVNHLEVPTTVHWHGIRLENRFDGVPDLTQPAVAPGEEFLYRLRFPDTGVFWYHPHVREDMQQDLGLYGNIFVAPAAGANSGPGRREFLILDDLLVGEAGLVPYGHETPTHAAMGRFGNVMLVNGETSWRATARPGEVVRFYLTNAANTRTFNLSFGAGIPIKVVGSDLGSYAREEWVESVVIAPAERYIVDVRFPAAGRVPLLNRVRAIDHVFGRFFDVTDTMGVVEVRGQPGQAPGFGRLAEGPEAGALDSLVAAYVGRAPERTLEVRVEFTGLPFVSLQLMRLDSIYFNPVEWEGTMPGMNWATTGTETRWILRDMDTGAENRDIHWRFRRGSLVRIRLVGTRNTLHGMQHPIHMHGQRFLVLAVNGKRNPNPVWKDTVLLPAGGSLDLLAEMSNPGTWMLHCHIAEHLQSGMMMHFDVEEP